MDSEHRPLRAATHGSRVNVYHPAVSMPTGRRSDLTRLFLALAAIAGITLLSGWLRIQNATTVALTFLVVVLITAAASRLWVAVATSVAAMLCINFQIGQSEIEDHDIGRSRRDDGERVLPRASHIDVVSPRPQ